MRRFVSTLGLILLAVIVFHQGASAETYLVAPDGSGDFPSIQEAIDAVENGDIIELTNGIFQGPGNRSIDYHGKAITIRSQHGYPTACVIDLQGNHGFRFQSGEGTASTLQGVTITNGYRYDGGGAIYCTSSSPHIRNCHFYSNEGYTGGGGIFCDYGACPVVEDCDFLHNHSVLGGGVCCFINSSPELTNCTFRYNSAIRGGGVTCYDSSAPTLTACVFSGNEAGQRGGAVHCELNCSPVFMQCTFFANSSFLYGGIYCNNLSCPALINCTFWNNRGTVCGGVYCGLYSSATLENTIIAFSAEGSAIYCEERGGPTLSCCDVYGNAGGDWVGCIAAQYGVDGNICEDPLFCDLLHPVIPDLRLHSDSPCAPFSPPNPECNLIGAWPVGCGDLQYADEDLGAADAVG
ncbi:MAG: hypothetical protein KAY24_18410, partial [Candidatus Eisenbacteria sp.]|nr:hypothetical protein [Candidatus Eisenbacteria bacterium]